MAFAYWRVRNVVRRYSYQRLPLSDTVQRYKGLFAVMREKLDTVT